MALAVVSRLSAAAVPEVQHGGSQTMPTGLQHALAVRKCEWAGQLCLNYSHCYSVCLKDKLTFPSIK